jgi:hypothetical protein
LLVIPNGVRNLSGIADLLIGAFALVAPPFTGGIFVFPNHLYFAVILKRVLCVPNEPAGRTDQVR